MDSVRGMCPTEEFDFSLRFRFFRLVVRHRIDVVVKNVRRRRVLENGRVRGVGISRSPYRSEDSVCQRLASTTGWWEDGYGAIGLDDSTQKIARMSSYFFRDTDPSSFGCVRIVIFPRGMYRA